MSSNFAIGNYRALLSELKVITIMETTLWRVSCYKTRLTYAGVSLAQTDNCHEILV